MGEMHVNEHSQAQYYAYALLALDKAENDDGNMDEDKVKFKISRGGDCNAPHG